MTLILSGVPSAGDNRLDNEVFALMSYKREY